MNKEDKPSMEPRRVEANQFTVWPMEAFYKMVDRILNEEIGAIVQFGHAEPDDDERETMRSMVMFNINAHVGAAGNA